MIVKYEDWMGRETRENLADTFSRHCRYSDNTPGGGLERELQDLDLGVIEGHRKIGALIALLVGKGLLTLKDLEPVLGELEEVEL